MTHLSRSSCRSSTCSTIRPSAGTWSPRTTSPSGSRSRPSCAPPSPSCAPHSTPPPTASSSWTPTDASRAATDASPRCGTSPSTSSRRDDDRVLSYVLDQLADPDGFLRKVEELYAQPEAESYDMLDFSDGRRLRAVLDPATRRRAGGGPGLELPRPHGAQTARGRARVPGVPRPAHRPPQQGALLRPGAARGRAVRTQRRGVRGPVPGRRQLQDRQRLAGARGRRSAPRLRRQAARELPARR